jgi:hypothetical protein
MKIAVNQTRHSKSPSSLQFHYNNIFLKITGESTIVLNRNVQDEWIVGQSRHRDGAPPPRGTTATPSRFLVDRFTKASQALLSITMSMLNMIK